MVHLTMPNETELETHPVWTSDLYLPDIAAYTSWVYKEWMEQQILQRLTIRKLKSCKVLWSPLAAIMVLSPHSEFFTYQ